MAFRKTNRIEKDDHQVVPNPNETTASDSLKEASWNDVLKERIDAELEAQKQRRRESGYSEE